jgi:hypothetical protein
MVRQRKCWQTKDKKIDALVETIENSLAGLK